MLVQNLLPEHTEEDVRELFETAGEVKSVSMDRDLSGRSKGSATIVFRGRAAADKAVDEFDPRSVDGSVLRVVVLGSVRGVLQRAPRAHVRDSP